MIVKFLLICVVLYVINDPAAWNQSDARTERLGQNILKYNKSLVGCLYKHRIHLVSENRGGMTPGAFWAIWNIKKTTQQTNDRPGS